MTTSDLVCGQCGTPMRVVAMTAAGTTSKCDCGALSLTRLSKGELDLGIVREPKLTDPSDKHIDSLGRKR